MENKHPGDFFWKDLRIGITGANGALGIALTKCLRKKGALITGFTHKNIQSVKSTNEGPHKWVKWQCGEEKTLDNELAKLNILIINHGFNPQGRQSKSDLNQALEVNALSSWRLLERFELIALERINKKNKTKKEIWINTSEAEIQPALSPAYEISKRLIGQLVSLRWSNLNKEQSEVFKIRKLILGPFKSNLNPFGLMNADWVASQISKQAALNLNLIIVTPNPLTYIIMPINECLRFIYSKLISKISS